MNHNKEFIDMSQFGLKATKQSENTILYELIGKEGHGTMLLCRLFPGIDIYFNDYHTTHYFSGKFDINNYFQISYSYEGTYEFELKDNRCIYIGEREMIAFHNIFETVQSRFSMGVFKGFGITFDIDTVNKTLKNYFKELSIDIDYLIHSLCIRDTVSVVKGNDKIQNILEDIYLADPVHKLAYIKIKLLELLNLLCTEKIEMNYKCKYYEKPTVLKIKGIKEHLTKDLSNHITIEQLAKDHNITKTMLKACFKDIYGLPPYEFLKRSRMNQAAVLIKTGKYSISEVGGMVGYQNASKFSSAFKDVMGITPSECSRRC